VSAPHPVAFTDRAAVPETVGVHAAQPWLPRLAPHTACGLLIYQRTEYVNTGAEVTCWHCRQAAATKSAAEES
jgi:hypothetical protein